MLVIDKVNPADALALLGESPPFAKALWNKWLRDKTLLAFIAEQDDMPVGLAIAESHPHVLHVITLEGDSFPCRLLLDRLVRRAGERDVSVWCPADRIDIQAMLDGLGFARQYGDDWQGRPSFLYHWARNEDVEE